MAILDLFKKREPHIVYLQVGREKQSFKIPTQYTTEEVERILEIQIAVDELKRTPVGDEEVEQALQIKQFWDLIYSQLLVLFQHYKPEIELSFLEQYVTQENALEIIAFHTNEHTKNVEEDSKSVKKKLIEKN